MTAGQNSSKYQTFWLDEFGARHDLANLNQCKYVRQEREEAKGQLN
jgi:hypothetical protein